MSIPTDKPTSGAGQIGEGRAFRDPVGRTSSEGSGRRPYSRPLLAVYGRLRDVTLGGTLGSGDSGGANQDPYIPPTP